MRALSLDVSSEHEGAPKRTALTLLWAFMTLAWSLFTPPHKTFPARVLIFQPLWSVRMYLGDVSWVQNLLLSLCLHAVYTYSTGVWRLPSWADLQWIDLHNEVTQIYIEVFSLLGACGGLAGGIVYRGHRMRAREEHSETLREQRIDEQLLPPLLIPSRTSHSRLFPEKHAFSYSYLFVGIPVGIKGVIGNALSVDSPKQKWFHVSAADYLARGGAHLGLAEKLKRYLRTQGVTDRDYAFAYLVTAPRFLGYSFNPVSFWYLYDSETVLKYMILEVNNTFDERRMYLLNADNAKREKIDVNGGLDSNGSTESSTKLVFTETWEKDFHVSPFNSRKGSYTLRATDPLAAYEESGQMRIDNTIILRSSKESAKIVARVYSEGEARGAAQVQTSELIKFVAEWWWVGLATFPRIVWEARKLFFQRQLHVWFRPEVTAESVGRTYTSDERLLECFFHAFLKEVVQNSKAALRVKYEPAHTGGEEIILHSESSTQQEDDQKTLTLQVLSPAFYSRFVHYAHVKEVFDRECLATDPKNKTLNIKNITQLPLLLDSIRKYSPQKPIHLSLPEKTRWTFLQRLRCPPPTPSYPHKPSSNTEDYDITDIRTFHASELDIFVQKTCSDAGVYRRIVTKLFFAQRFAFGIPFLVSAVDWILRAVFIWATFYFSDRWRDIDILRPRVLGKREYSLEDVGTFVLLVGLANGIHFWSLLKG